MLFHVIPEAQCVLRSRGVFRQVPMFRRNQQLFAKWSSGFVMLRANGGTSIPHVSWDHIEGVEYLSPPIGALQSPPPDVNAMLKATADALEKEIKRTRPEYIPLNVADPAVRKRLRAGSKGTAS